MKKICFLLFFLLIGMVGCEPQHYLIIGIELAPVELYFSENVNGKMMPNYHPVREFKDIITFQIRGELEYVFADKINMNTNSRCYAFQPGEVTDNRILEETYSMTFDKSFTHAGTVVEAGVNILQEQAIMDEIIVEGEIGAHHSDMLFIKFNDTFSENALFDNDSYTITFSCRTSDELFLQTNTTVKFPTK